MNHIHPPSRRAVLIGAAGTGGERLPGVRCDLENMREYLLSPRGGAWHADEVLTLDNPNSLHAWQKVQGAVSDYTFVYLSGHGFIDIDGNNMFCLRDGNLCDNQFFNGSIRQLILVDACREYLPRISGIPKEIEKWLYASGYSEARSVFDKCILASPPGEIIVHATGEGEPARDTTEGGSFTNALLHAAFRYKPLFGSHPVFIDSLMNDTTLQFVNNGSLQRPCIIEYSGNFQVPFAIASANFLSEKVKRVRSHMLPAEREYPRAGIAAAMLLLVVWAASK